MSTSRADGIKFQSGIAQDKMEAGNGAAGRHCEQLRLSTISSSYSICASTRRISRHALIRSLDVVFFFSPFRLFLSKRSRGRRRKEAEVEGKKAADKHTHPTRATRSRQSWSILPLYTMAAIFYRIYRKRMEHTRIGQVREERLEILRGVRLPTGILSFRKKKNLNKFKCAKRN